MPHDLIRHWIILFLNHIGLPLNCKVTFLKKVLNRCNSWFNDTSATLLYPVALGARVALPVNSLDHEGLKPLFVLE